MLLCFGSWNRAGGVGTLFLSYYRQMKINVPHCWILVGKSPVPSFCLREDTYSFVIKDDWNIYLNRALCQNISEKIKELVRENRIKGLFLPLEYHLFPYLRDMELPVLYISHLLNKPLMESAEKQWYSEFPALKKGLSADLIRLQVERSALSCAQYIICNSDVTKKDLIKHYNISNTVEIFVSEPGVSKKRWRNIELGDKRHALYFGRLTHQKGIPNLMKLKKSSLNITIAGTGRMRETFQPQEKSRYDFTEWVEVDRLKQLLDRSLFCLFPSHYEPWGLALNEALSAGKICMAQKGAGGHELQIENNVNGFLVDFNTSEAELKIKSAALAPQKNIELISKNAKKSASDIEKHLQFVSETVTRFYSRLISGHFN